MQKGEYLLKKERIGKAVWKLMLPAVLTSLISMIYNFTDTFFIGLLRNTDQLSALSLAMPLMWLFGTLPGLISAGAGQVISLKLGAGDKMGAKQVASFSVFGTLLLGLLSTAVSLPLMRPCLKMMGAQGAVLEYAAQYLGVIVLGHVFAAGGAMLGVQSAHGRANIASIGNVIGIAVNIALDPLFIFVFDMGVTGAALATVLGSASSMVFGLIVSKGYLSVRNVIPDKKTVKKVFGLSLSSTATSIVSSLIVAATFSMATGFGNETVAAISVASKLYSFIVSLVSAMCFSLQPFAGYNYAADNRPRLRKGLLLSLGAGTAVCLAGMLLFLFAGGPYMRLFTEDPVVIGAGEKIIRYFAVSAPILALNMTAMMLLSATGKAMRSLIAGMSRQVLIFVPLMIVLRRFFGMDGLILAFPISDILATILACAMCAGDVRRIFGKK